MIKKLIKHSVFILLIAMSLNTSFAAPFTGGADSNLTGAAGTLIGTVPSVSNASGETGKVDFIKDDKHDASRQLDVGDNVTLSWNFIDGEGDVDASVSSVVWRCDHPQKGVRTLATGVSNYTITNEDLGCNIGVSLKPQTSTGIPRENEALTIADITAYNDKDNIIVGPVNPHAIHITEYTVAPGTTQSRPVAADLILRTGWNGAKLQLETDNIASQVTWDSSDNAVATVSSTGLVTFKTKGKATITAHHDAVSESITFNPSLFFIFSTEKMNWNDGKAWCEGQGYTMASITQLSTEKNLRKIPQDSLWQEWGDISQQGVGNTLDLYWSSTVFSSGRHDHLHINNGYTASEVDADMQPIACIMP